MNKLRITIIIRNYLQISSDSKKLNPKHHKKMYLVTNFCCIYSS